ncbi:MAG TPA: hypothetical protein VK961_18950, partial [Chthoniobacter sp.]|nr:hypothetical protein [Chthoniobacter sp.]
RRREGTKVGVISATAITLCPFVPSRLRGDLSSPCPIYAADFHDKTLVVWAKQKRCRLPDSALLS